MAEKNKGVSASVPSDRELKLLEAKRNVIFQRIQQIYDSSKDAQTDVHKQESFLSSVVTLDTLRTEFQNLLDKYNDRLLTIDPNATPQYYSLISFDELYGRIQLVKSQINPQTNSKEASLRKNKPTLPPIELRSFDGDILSWPLFYANFKSTIHDNTTLTDSERMYYLLGKLTGKALTACSGITPCAENYSLLLQTLIDKYDDKRMIAATYLDQLLEFKPISANADNLDSFIEKFVAAFRGLKNLKLPDLADFIVLHIGLKKLDSDSIHTFERLGDSSTIPTFEDLVNFIKNQSKIMQRTSVKTATSGYNAKKNTDRSRSNTNKSSSSQKFALVTTVDKNKRTDKCLCDNVTHQQLFKCPRFMRATPEERFQLAKQCNACVNCLNISHNQIKLCNSTKNCRKCNLRHSTWLHFTTSDSNSATSSRAPDAVCDKPPGASPAITSASPSVTQTGESVTQDKSVAMCTTSIAASGTIRCKGLTQPRERCTTQSSVLLATAQVIAYDSKGNTHLLRCLLDSAADTNFITTDCCKRLSILQNNIPNTMVRGFGGSENRIDKSVLLQFHSKYKKNIKFDISALVVDKITGYLPTTPIDTDALSHINNLPLADDTFAIPSPIDVLIGASLFPHLLLPEIIRGAATSPPAIHTVLGYVLMGSVPTRQPIYTRPTATSCCAIVGNEHTITIDELVKRFWEIQELTCPPVYSPADNECEELYRVTTERDPVSGRYSVALPFCEDVFSLGNSYNVAYNRFLCLERKLEASHKLREAYDNVIVEYLQNKYISPAPVTTANKELLPTYIIPHHGVVREDKASTRLRVVLDATCPTSSGVSLNDILHSGPNLQGDLFQIILNFRLFAIALSADCKQMFLQIAVREQDRRFQRILYRFHPSDPISTFEFNRVCFGLKSSPYHALRTVKQLVSDDGDKYPLASRVAASSIYMDDLVFSVKTEDEGAATAKELIDLFKGAQWDLLKWSSNSSQVSNSIPATHRLPSEVEFDKSDQHKILGLRWSTSTDTFYFKVSLTSATCSKRAILSTIARLWDIMGFLAPTILFAKLLIKKLWLLNIDWDEIPPPSIIKTWEQFCAELPKLNEFRIPRYLGVADGTIVTLVGFSDASELAYGAVVYLHVQSASGVTVQLVCAKSKVAPVKTLSVARLELCGAVVLAKLLRTVYDNYNPRYDITNVFAFTDSKVTLYWIKNSPHRWQTFVANRVVIVNDHITANNFYYVPGVENPADCLSRGLTPNKLLDHPLWLRGPHWMTLPPSQWPLKELVGVPINEIPEQKTILHTTVVEQEESIIYELAKRSSSWTKLLHTLVYVFRFVKLLPRRESANTTLSDIEFAENKLLHVLQRKYFTDEFQNLNNAKSCSPALQRLNPFLEKGLIRVGGRLSQSSVSHEQMHPIILPRTDHIINLLIDYYHKKYLHAGPELLMSLLRQRYWIMSARRSIRTRVHKCNTCFKLKPRSSSPLMADLPSIRVTPAIKAFLHTGCDYAGPISYIPIRRRGAHSHKAYLCIFTCMTTRAVHIEIATDLSTENFILALRRFLGRRGPVETMQSDQGRNFIGTRSYLRELYEFINKNYRSRFEEELIENRITWKFIPPVSPHFGACWESMVRVIKTHLFKVIGQQLLSYEELNTVLVQIECLLNSRPLTALSSDPTEPAALTPSHFLHTAPLNSLPAPDEEPNNLRLSQRFSLLNKIVQSFWKRWSNEYLLKLQVRQKWNTPSVPITAGTVVIINTDNAPPLAWPIGIIDKIHPSKDGVVRVASVRTTRGTFLRPVIRLCPLPNQ